MTRSDHKRQKGIGVALTYQQMELEELERLREVAAKLVVADPVYAPIFERIESDIAELEAIAANDVVARARAVIHSATR